MTSSTVESNLRVTRALCKSKHKIGPKKIQQFLTYANATSIQFSCKSL